MISIRIQKLTKRFGLLTALDQVDLEIAPGELFFLLGPSGSGKTTLLRNLAGFMVPDEGAVFFGGDDVTRLAPHKRNIAMMFQNYALWPHMSVSENVAFGLEERRVPRKEIARRVGEALDVVRMGPHASRRPDGLSGGEQQRVALARALVIRPRCLLLDEPLASLDAPLRLELRSEIRRVCKEFNLTTVYVTHEQKEALSIADRIGVLDGGCILQVGTPREIYRRPVRRSVANFIGESNFIAGEIVVAHGGGRATVRTAAGRFDGVLGDPQARPEVGAAVTVSIRPECWTLGDRTPALNGVRGRIGVETYLGEIAHYDFEAAGTRFKIFERNPRPDNPPGRGELYASVEPEDVVILVA